MRQIELVQEIQAAVGQVWNILVDHERMPQWMPVREVVRRRPGTPDPNGVGAIRTLRGSGVVVEERITSFKPCEKLEYVVTEGVPIRDHRGEIQLTPLAQGTRVCWRVQFRPLIPGTGWLLERVVCSSLRAGLSGLKRLAEDRIPRSKNRSRPC